MSLGIDCWDGTESQVQNFKEATNPQIQYPLLLNGSSTQSNYGVNYEWSMVIDQAGIIQYSATGVAISSIQSKIDELLAPSSLEDDPGVPRAFDLKQNYPNPFNPQTTIPFSIKRTQKISLKIFDAQGRLIRTLINANLPAGSHEFTWNGLGENGQSVASGIYYYILSGERREETKQMLFLK